MSSTRFYLSNALRFRDTTQEIFDDKTDKLLQDMLASIQRKTRYNENNTHPTMDTALLMEITAANRSIDAIIEPNPDITNARKDGNNYTDSIGTFSTAVVIEHIPNRINGVTAPVPISGIRHATHNVSLFMAAMGQNFYADYHDGKLFVLYDIMEQEFGFEIPRSFLICMALAMAFSLSLWTLVEWQLDDFYTSSLYKSISAQIAYRNNSSAPMLMRSEVRPVVFEGFKLLPDNGVFEMEANSTTALRT
ncbi:hypothetical protein BGZ68_007454 [Mortierella alpina]|nr:hypothetical protein BGZ68_007454 [Mortierella alpina]